MIDDIWERKYAGGFEQRYPWDSVVSFVFRYAPKDVERSSVQILETGFGSGSNLWFVAREGFSVSGIEASQTAVDKARERFKRECLSGELKLGDFTSLPFESSSFDLVIDRAAITHVGRSEHCETIGEIHRVLKMGGFFHFNAYADSHSSYRSGSPGPDNLRVDISAGSLLDVGQVYFSSRTDIDSFFEDGWKLHQVQRREWVDMLNATDSTHAEWMVVAEKT